MNRSLFATRAVRVTLTVVVLGIAQAAPGQPLTHPGGRVVGLVGASVGDGGPAPSVGGGVGLRLTRQLGMDVELLHINGLDLSTHGLLVQRGLFPVPAPFELMDDGNVTVFMARVIAEFPVAGDRLVPFVAGGGGVGRLSEHFGVDCRQVCLLNEPIGRLPLLTIFPVPDVERSETGLALTVGGGLDVGLWKGLAVGADVRWVRLLLNQGELDLAHIASRVSYRF